MAEERSALITLGGEEYELVCTMKAMKEIGKRCGGFDAMGEMLSGIERDPIGAIDTIVWLVTLLANQSILVHNLKNKDTPRDILTEESVELLATIEDFFGLSKALMESMSKGMARHVESAPPETDEGNAVAG